MIVTVTPNTGLDRTLLVPHFKWGETIRSEQAALGMGGKAIDASWVLGELGVESLALGFAAGASGEQMEQMLHEKGVRTNFTWVDGETRTNTVIVSNSGEGQTTLTSSGLLVDERHLEQFRLAYEAALEGASCVVIGGSLPDGVPLSLYTQFVEVACLRGISVIFDASGKELAAGLAGSPTLIKPNRAELEELVGRPLVTVEDVYAAACRVRDQYGCMVVATLGSAGALAVTHSAPSEALYVAPLKVKVVSAAGAGDAILAGLAHAFANHLPLQEGLRLGFAAAAAVLMTLKTADCRRSDVLELTPQVKMLPYGEISGSGIHV